jgi:6-phosphogluconolactonase (cycloisomerase 2 family)
MQSQNELSFDSRTKHVGAAWRFLAPPIIASFLSACPPIGDPKDPLPPGPTPTTYTVGGTVSGLNGSITLANNSDNKVLAASGAFTFATSLATGIAYNVTVTAKPASQQCTVTNGSGSIASSNVSNVTVTCVNITYTVGGTVSGLTGSGLVLQNNGVDNLARSADGAFTFATAITSGAAYAVSVLSQPTAPAQTCTPANGSGNVATNVTNVTITCVTNPPSGVTNIGPAGGTVNGHYGAQIIVPAGALATTVGIGLKRDSTDSPAFAVTDIDAIGATYELTPHGQSFTTPVTLRIPFDPTQLPNDEAPVLYKAEAGGAFTALPTTVNGNFLETTVTGFSWVIPASQATRPRMVYAIQAAGTFTAGALASFKINRATGALSAVSSTAAIGDSPVSVIAHPSRRFVYVTNGGSNTLNNIAPNSVSAYPLSAVNGNIMGPATSTVTTSALLGYIPTMPAIHPSGKFLYVMNFGRVSFNDGGDIDLFTINAVTGELTRSGSISGGGAQPMAMAFNRLGTIAYVLYAGSSSSNTFSSQIKVYSVDVTTGTLTGPSSGVQACVLGGNPWSLRIDPNDKFAYAACLSTDELLAYSINSTTGALTNAGTLPVTGGSKLASLAIDSFGRFLFAARQQPWLNQNVLSYQVSATTGALTLANGVLTGCPGGGCVGPIAAVTDPQGQFVYALDSQGGLSAFAVNQTTGALTTVNSLAGIYRPSVAGIGVPFSFAATGTSPVFQNNCTTSCAMIGTITSPAGGGGGSGGATNPSPPTSNYLTITMNESYGGATSSPAGINIAPPSNSNPLPPNDFRAAFPAGSSVTVCATEPPQPIGPYDITWSGSCSGTNWCTTVTMTSDKQCHAGFSHVMGR